MQYIIERLETGLRNVHLIHDVLRDGVQELEQPEDREIATDYSRKVGELEACIQTMLSYWHLYQDRLQSQIFEERCWSRIYSW